MHCPFCRHPDSRVVDSRTADDAAIAASMAVVGWLAARLTRPRT